VVLAGQFRTRDFNDAAKFFRASSSSLAVFIDPSQFGSTQSGSEQSSQSPARHSSQSQSQSVLVFLRSRSVGTQCYFESPGIRANGRSVSLALWLT
jgi:hypothetical protein